MRSPNRKVIVIIKRVEHRIPENGKFNVAREREAYKIFENL